MDNPVWQWFGRAVRRYPAWSAALVVLSIATSLADGLSISLLIPFLTTLFNGPAAAMAHTGRMGEVFALATRWAGPGNELAALSCLIVGLVALASILKYVESIIASWVSGQISSDFRSRIHGNLLHTEYEFLCVNDNGRLLYTLDTGTWSATEAITACFGLVTSICMVVVLTTVLVLISWKLSLLVTIMVLAVSALMAPFNRRARAIGVETTAAAEDLTERAVGLFDDMRMIRAFGRERDAQAGFDRASRRLFDISMRGERVTGAAGTLQEILYAVTSVTVVFAGLALGIGGATLVAFLALLHRLQPYVRAIDGARIHLAGLEASGRSVADLLDLKHWAVAAQKGAAPPQVKDAIRFDNVSYAYAGQDQERRNAIEAVTLEIPIGKVTAVVGWSGAGKSTLTNMLLRFYDPDEGSITVDGVPLTRLDLPWWRGRLAIAGQDAELFSGTIAENIGYGKEDATAQEIVEAARRASVHDFIMTLPHGYETRVGARGALLSGGQRQRIGLARAFIRKDAILILDEATNSLDSMTEDEILRAMEAMPGHVTVIVIAHRLSTTRMADRVAVLAEGRVVEAGTPQALYRQNGLYTRMVQLQELSLPRHEAHAEAPPTP
jgi:subfamily B ATP-binding cassette protein MsbA